MNNNIGGPQLVQKTLQIHHYLIFVWGGVSAETHGPYPTLQARDQAALIVMDGDSEESSVHTLDIYTASKGSVSVEVGDYGCDFFEDEVTDNGEEADEVED